MHTAAIEMPKPGSTSHFVGPPKLLKITLRQSNTNLNSQ